jgi:AraC-like DNA-binding protein
MATVAIPLRWSLVSAGRATSYREFPPATDLEETVRCTWEGRAGWPRHLRLLPDGCCDLTWDGRTLAVAPARGGAVRYPVTTLGPAVGIRLRPEVARPILCHNLSELVGPTDLGDLWGAARVRGIVDMLVAAVTVAAQRSVLETLVRWRLGSGARADPHIRRAAAVLAIGRPVDVAAAEAGLSGRELRRRFADDTGLGPKTFQRILRFHRFLAISDANTGTSRSLAAFALAAGYADQAHLTRECARLAGSTPAALLVSRGHGTS